MAIIDVQWTEARVRMMEDLERALRKPIEKRRWAIVIDLGKCTGCTACTTACVAENHLPPGVVYRPVIHEETGKFPNVRARFIPRPCMHCDNPPCTKVCPAIATWRRPDGIVVVDYEKCIGCRYCITACPYNARTFDKGYYWCDGTPEIPKYEKLPSFEYGKTWPREDRESSPVGNVRKRQFNLFVENVAKGRHSFTGEHFSGIPIYEPAKDASGKPVTWPEEYAFQLFTFKPILVGQSRTICNYWTQIAEFGTNYVMMNPEDMRRPGLKDGDVVRLIGPSNPEGMIRVRKGLALKVQGAVKGYEGIRPGTVAVCHGYGRFGYGAYDQVVDGKRIPGDVRRAVGLSANPVMLADPVLKNVCLSDLIGGSCSFFDSRVKVVKVSGAKGEKPWEVWEKWAQKVA